jgi:hypothetical protein
LEDADNGLPLISVPNTKARILNYEVPYIDCETIVPNNVAFWPKPNVTITYRASKSKRKNKSSAVPHDDDTDDDDTDDIDNDEIVNQSNQKKSVRLTFSPSEFHPIVEHNHAEFRE